MFDETFDDLDHIVRGEGDQNHYKLGRIGEHNVVMNRPNPPVAGGQNRAIKIATDMKSTFSWIRFILLVGIGGAAPSLHNDIRLGDVVFGLKVVPYVKGTMKGDGAVPKVAMEPPGELLSAITELGIGPDSKIPLTEVMGHVSSTEDSTRRPRASEDNLYEESYSCKGIECNCNRSQVKEKGFLKSRPDPKSADHIMIHGGVVGSADQAMQSGLHRTKYQERHDIICFETGAAEVMTACPCLTIRGISNYSDGHNMEKWNPYASLVAALCAKRLLGHIKASLVQRSTIEYKPCQLQSYVKGATHTANQTIGQLNCFQGNVNDTERTVSALLERHQFVVKFVNDVLPYLKKDSVRKEMKKDIGDRNTEDFFDRLKSIEYLQRDLKQSLDSLTRKVRRQGKQPTRHNPESGCRDDWKRLRRELDNEVYLAEELSSRIEKSLSISGRLLSLQADDRKNQKTQGIWQKISTLFDDFTYSIQRIPARLKHKWRGFRGSGRRQSGHSMNRYEHQNSEEPTVPEEEPSELPTLENEIYRHVGINQAINGADFTDSLSQRAGQPDRENTIFLSAQSHIPFNDEDPELELQHYCPPTREPPSPPNRPRSANTTVPCAIPGPALDVPGYYSPARTGGRLAPSRADSDPSDTFSQYHNSGSSSSSLPPSKILNESPASRSRPVPP